MAIASPSLEEKITRPVKAHRLSNLAKRKDALLKEHVTIVMAPFESYSSFSPAIDSLYRNTPMPFYLIVIEGNAPDAVRESLEREKKRHKNMRIIYTNHRPNLAESWNIALPHVQTSYIFLTDNELRFSRGWLSHLLKATEENEHGIVCPDIPNDNSDKAISIESSDPNYLLAQLKLHGFLISKQAMEKIGPFFDDSVSALVTGLDISLKAKAENIPIRIEPQARLLRDPSRPLSASDRELFNFQWSSEKIGKSLKYIRKKWCITLEEDKYFSWLDQNRRRIIPQRLSFLGNFTYRLQSQLAFAKCHVMRFFEPSTGTRE